MPLSTCKLILFVKYIYNLTTVINIFDSRLNTAKAIDISHKLHGPNALSAYEWRHKYTKPSKERVSGSILETFEVQKSLYDKKTLVRIRQILHQEHSLMKMTWSKFWFGKDEKEVDIFYGFSDLCLWNWDTRHFWLKRKEN